ncbi:hypothetical protein C7974DRAFT_451825 [Boeremia exigua]|uniref:uncharacterized protein n=1 Tax=Boeremia exigua TaxID=749465 RepID=UPI001E8DF4F0|nr:uncharacterized protein C7974DRAFT_451825 [Boeremia exigua]KAH6638436.1 hypothetical protein C7974DRAFT_451825 [Boeremia exigua]
MSLPRTALARVQRGIHTRTPLPIRPHRLCLHTATQPVYSTPRHRPTAMPTTRQQDAAASTLTSRSKPAAGGKSHRASATNCMQHWEDAEHLASNQAAFLEFRRQSSDASVPASDASGTSDSTSGDHGPVHPAMKRGRGANQIGNTSKKAKSAGGLAKGDKTRVPRVGQEVFFDHGGKEGGEVVEVLYEEKVVGGEKAEASKEDPRLVVKKGEGEEGEVWKPEDVWFD